MYRSSARLLTFSVAVSACLVSASLAADASSGPAVSAPASTAPSDRFIVHFAANAPERTDPRVLQSLLDAAGHSAGVHLIAGRSLAIDGRVIGADRALDSATSRRVLQALSANAHVVSAERDTLLQPLATPTDPGYASQWDVFEAAGGINLPKAWDKATGRGVVVAVVDTGITSHADLARAVLHGYDFIDDAAIAVDGGGRDADPSDPGDWRTAGACGIGTAAADSSWHGAHVAGLIAARANNRVGIAGVAFDAQILPVRALGRCGGHASDVADAIVWASGGKVPGVPMNRNPAEVINLSIGAPVACGPTLQAAIDSAVAAGSVVVAGAGNSHADAALFAPGGCRNVIDVGAVGRSGAQARYSNHGSHIDISAPGGDGSDGLLSTANIGKRYQATDGYARKQGTSQAAALVSGVVALMQGVHANTPETVKSILRASARAFAVPCRDGCGAGIVDAGRAISTLDTPTLSVSDVSITEGNSGTRSLNFVVSLSAASATPVTFKFATADGTASAGSDYVARALTGRTIAAGGTSTQIGVTINGDATVESDETLLLNISNAVGATIADAQGTGTITNDDSVAALPTLSVSDVVTSEGSQAVFVVQLSAPSATPVSFKFATSDGTATVANNDYVPKALTGRTIPAGQTTSQIGVTTVEDTTTEPKETFALDISQPTGATIADAQGIASIGNDDPGPVLRISNVSQYEGDSGTTQFLFTASLDSVATGPVTFDVATTDGSAVAGSDYVALAPTPKTIPQGSLSTQFTVDVIGDTAAENDEFFNIVVSQLSGATESTLPGKTGTILDDEAPKLSIDSSHQINEGNSGTVAIVFGVFLNHPATSPVTFHYATTDDTATAASGDYVAKSASRTIAVGDTYTEISFTINGDTTLEPKEQFFVDLSGATGATIANGRGTAVIQNDDGPTISLAVGASTVEGNSGTHALDFTINLSAPSPQDVAYTANTYNNTCCANAAIAGTDYVATTVNGTIPAGQTTATFSVPITGDTTVEENEVVGASVVAVSGAHSADSRTGTILNDDGATMSIGDVSITEGNSGNKNATFTVTLSQAVATNVQFSYATADGTTSANSDYFPTNSSVPQTITAGQTAKTFTVTLIGDTNVEANETFFVNLTQPVPGGATLLDNQAIGTILNDD